MKGFLKSELLPDSNPLFCRTGRKFNTYALWITLLLFVLTSLLYSQSTNNTSELFPYDKAYFENDYTQSTDSNLTLLSQLGIGPCVDAVIVGNYAYVGNGGLFQILDVSDPLNPVLIGEVLTPLGYIKDIEIYGNYAFLVTPFTVINISDPFNPSIVSELPTVGGGKLRVVGTYAYIGAFYVTHIVDISDPLQPQQLSSMVTGGDGVMGIAIKEPYLYVSTVDGLQIDIFDISDKNNPVWINTYFFGSLGGDLYIKDNYLYAGLFNFSVFDITDPTQLVYVNGLTINALAFEIEIIDTLAYLSLGGNQPNGGLSIVSMGNLNNLYEVAHIKSVNSPFEYFTCEVENNYAYITSGIGLDIFNLQNPATPEYISSYLASWEIDKMKVHNNLLFCSGIYCGFKIINYSDPQKLKVLGQYQEKTFIKDFDVSDFYAYLLTDHSVIILNIQNPLSPYKINEIVFTDTIPMTGSGSVILKDSILIVSLPASHFTRVNILDPFNPFVIDSTISGGIRDLSISDDYLFSAEGTGGLQIYKLADPPYKVKTLEGFNSLLLIEDSLLYTYLDDFGIYNIKDPETLVLLGTTDILGISFGEIGKSGNYVSLAYYYNLEIIDVSNPYNPFTAAYSRNERYTSVASVNNLIFAGNEHRGIKTFKNDLITSINSNKNKLVIEENYLFQNYPNPFNSNTTIKYSVSENNYIRLKLYDVLGNEIMTIDEGFRTPDIYTVNIKTENLSTGVYLYRFLTDNQNITKKLILLK